MPAKARPSTKSGNANTKDRTGAGRAAKPRAHRGDTPEAMRQKEGSSKTHPTRNAKSGPGMTRRKDK